ncbi:hypothetical protein ALPO108162_03695 [Alicyclobacillus pomorum]
MSNLSENTFLTALTFHMYDSTYQMIQNRCPEGYSVSSRVALHRMFALQSCALFTREKENEYE